MKKAEIDDRIKKIKLIMMDVDGVLTDGRILYDREGHELKYFHASDGAGMLYARRAGLKIIMISGNFSHAVEKRASITKVDALYQKVLNKKELYHTLLQEFSVVPEEICYIGDDLVDLPVMMQIGFAVTVPDAPDELKEIAHYITKKKGGYGAVRELIEVLLKTQGSWDSIVKRYLL